MTDIPRSEAVKLLQKFDYNLELMTDHIYIDEFDNSVKFMDPKQVKKMVFEKLNNISYDA